MIHKHFFSRQFLRFLLVGGVAAAINFVSRIFLSEIMSYRWAVFVAYLIGMLTAYLLSRAFVFEPSSRKPLHELYYFSLVNVLAVCQVWGISVLLAEYVFPKAGFGFYPEEIAHIIGLSVPIFTSFLGHKYWSFKPKYENE
ncbi:MAG: GtrA family protein [Thioalkalispiraceae bacterium]|jgi:putative flippase GtrA